MQGRSFPFQKLVPKLNVRHLYTVGLIIRILRYSDILKANENT